MTCTPAAGRRRLRIKQCGLTGRGVGAGDPPLGAGCQAKWAPALHRASPAEGLERDSPPRPAAGSLLCRRNWRGERGSRVGSARVGVRGSEA